MYQSRLGSCAEFCPITLGPALTYAAVLALVPMHSTDATAAPELTLYYDGQCPLCLAEVEFLQSRNAQGQLAFVDVTQTGFEASGHNISCEAAMAQIHGRTANGQVLIGVPVFAMAYKLAKLPVLAWLLSRRWLMPVLQPAYVLFAKHRQTLSKRIGPTVLRLSKRFLR
jgi:predicted DCC family thiol-disulfide oxidoreductase YuxK